MSESSSDIMELEEGTLFTHPEITKKSNCNPRHNNNINPACVSIETDVWLLGTGNIADSVVSIWYQNIMCGWYSHRFLGFQWRRRWQRGGRCWVSCGRTTTVPYGAWRRPPSHVVVVVATSASVARQPVQPGPSIRGALRVRVVRDYEEVESGALLLPSSKKSREMGEI